jgi:hypothetical protein
MALDMVMPVLVLGAIGIGFGVAYFMRKKLLWWALIPALGAFTLLAAVLSELVVGTDPKNDWFNVLVMAAGTAVMAAVLKRPAVRQVMIIVTAITLLVAIAMAPLATILKIVLIAADILVGLFLAMRGGTG